MDSSAFWDSSELMATISTEDAIDPRTSGKKFDILRLLRSFFFSFFFFFFWRFTPRFGIQRGCGHLHSTETVQRFQIELPKERYDVIFNVRLGGFLLDQIQLGVFWSLWLAQLDALPKPNWNLVRCFLAENFLLPSQFTDWLNQDLQVESWPFFWLDWQSPWSSPDGPRSGFKLPCWGHVTVLIGLLT